MKDPCKLVAGSVTARIIWMLWYRTPYAADHQSDKLEASLQRYKTSSYDCKARIGS